MNFKHTFRYGLLLCFILCYKYFVKSTTIVYIETLKIFEFCGGQQTIGDGVGCQTIHDKSIGFDYF
ncbi:hypothetical protein [Microscilla marina]|uniref:Uncharacterized protein n=1 Tax=Microscilla marina ATCC 23134 TaxID=313606 RepID=A1ZVZ3_MICM2|nr:hypothetical protein [Microscilla marina]EAY25475.1 hypothetical protein M23134_00829 [Microscilla marina ATCC 23134]